MPERIELTPSQRTRCNRLIRRLCANYDNGNCLPLDEGDGCVCVQMISLSLMNDREVNPEKYIAPDNWYKYGEVDVKAYKIRIQPQLDTDKKKCRRFYESKLSSQPDVVDVADVVRFTGYNRRTVSQWIRLGKLRALVLPQKYMIPKCYLIDWLCSDEYNNTNRKSREHINMLWELSKWNDGRC